MIKEARLIIFALLLVIPLSLGLRLAGAPSLWIFLASAAAVAVLAEWIRRAAEQLATSAGPAIGGLLTVSFGSIAELVLALFVLASGDTAVVQAQITGSILGTGLLGLGLAILVGSAKRQRQCRLAFPGSVNARIDQRRARLESGRALATSM